MEGSFTVGLVLLSVFGATVGVPYGPSCKEECDKTFTNDDIIQHPGIKQICHRGCELFTVAFIATPRGGVPLIGPKPGVIPPAIMATLDEFGVPLGPALFPVQKKKFSSNKTREEVIHKKQVDAKKEKEEIVKEIEEKMEGVLKANRAQKTTGDDKKFRQMVNAENNKKMKEVEEAIRKTISNQKTTNQKQSTSKEPNSKKQNLTPNRYSNEKDIKGTITVVKQKIDSDHVKDKIDEKVSEFRSGLNSGHIIAYTGDKARKILNKFENSLKNEKNSITEKAKPNHGNSNTKLSKGANSKTTVLPVPHPVQDHPVLANKQITTDSSNDRKATTPKSPKVSILKPYPYEPRGFGHEFKLVEKLNKKTNYINPIIEFIVPRPKSRMHIAIPQQISIIEIVKKKNNIDFEKLHRDHIQEASALPEIGDRLNQAKQSCRHACTTAYNMESEKEACIVGCHIRASDSMDQVGNEKNKDRKTDLFSGNGKLLSSVSDLFSSFVNKFTGIAEKEMQGLGTKLNSMGGSKSNRNIGIEMTIQKSGPITFQTERVIELKDGQKIEPTMMDNKKLMDGNMKSFDDLFTGTIEHRFQEFEKHNKDVQKVLNKEIEIMGLHLNEKPTNLIKPNTIPNWINDIIRPSSFNFGQLPQPETKEDVFEEAIHDIFNAEAEAEKKKEQHLNSRHENEKNAFVITDFTDNFDVLRAKESENNNPGFPRISVTQLQQLDLLDCISRKSGLPRWLIGLSIFSTAIAVFWLCFSLSSHSEESKLMNKKRVPPPMIICDDHNSCNFDSNCSLKQPLLSEEKCLKLHLETV